MHSSEKSRSKKIDFTSKNDTGRLLTPNDLAWLLGIRKSTVYALTSAKKVPHIKIGNLLRFRVEDIELWLQEQKHHGIQPHPRRSALKISAKKQVSSQTDRINRLIEDAKREVVERDYAEDMN